MSVQVYYVLGQTDGERKSFFGGCKKGEHTVRLPPVAFSCHNRWKSLSFCEIWNNSTPSLLFIRPPYKEALQDMEFYYNFVDRFQDLSKVKNPAVSKAIRSNNYFELSKENVLGNMMLSHWLLFTWKFFMIWFHKILKLISQK